MIVQRYFYPLDPNISCNHTSEGILYMLNGYSRVGDDKNNSIYQSNQLDSS